MDLFNFEKGADSTVEQTFRAIKDRIGMSQEEFLNLPENEKNSWVDACRLALLLEKTSNDKLLEGYRETDMYSDKGTFNLGAATDIIKGKKALLDTIERGSDIDLTPAEFVLMGDSQSRDFAANAMQLMNIQTVKEINAKKQM